ncbi:MAG: 1-acyl-sn-glycerol-3-phosphate acyltransferase [Leptospiraceae bacterium]|nr:1-acyl-sn-glycerol-3-phosphate acyltransferase [Leptospiraceae bacterium]MCK6381700.1 1-acyl-sn-glycerol-3-phosphate acyltransferase [Leptospiraceae bacterium]
MTENIDNWQEFENTLKLFTLPREAPVLALRTLLELVYNVSVTGTELIPKAGGAVIVCNHTDILDIPVQGVYSPRKIVFLGKYEIFRPQDTIIEYLSSPSSPFQSFPLNLLKPQIENLLNAFGNVYSNQLQKWGSMPIIRGHIGEGAGAKAAVAYYEELENYMVSLVKSGEILSIYPEGTRSETGIIAPFKALAAKIAIRAQVPIIPSGINGAWRMSEPKAFLSGQAFKTKITYNIGMPILPDDFPKGHEKKSAKELTERLEKAVYFLAHNRERRGKPRRVTTVL